MKIINKQKKLVYVGFAFEHHKGTHAGYYHIKDYAQYDYYIDCQKYFDKTSHASNFIVARCVRRVMRLIFGYPYFPTFLIKMILLSFQFKCVFHIIHGENIYSPRMKWLLGRSKVVCTFHQPFNWFNNKTWRKYLRTVDGIILLSDKEISLFKQISQNDNVMFIPHGVFTDFYHPLSNPPKEKMILTVGNWLRDYELADKVYSMFLQKHPDWQIYVVANKDATKNIHSDTRIHCLTGISDDDLRLLYAKSSVLFLPLIRYTANNALLEAAACGCNILIATNHADNSYVPDRFIDIVPMEIGTIQEQLEQKIYNNIPNTELEEYIVDNYSWRTIGQKVTNYLRIF